MPDSTQLMYASPDTASARTGRLLADLQALRERAASGPISFGQILEVLAERGHAVLIVLFAVPFLIPTPPGFSTPAGLAIGMLGLCVMANLRPWLPGFVARREVSTSAVDRIVGGTSRVLLKVEKLIKPRLQFMLAPVLHWMIGLSLVSAAFILALPIPIPWNNGPPAICILILAFGLLERDGLLILVGHVYNLAMWVALYFAGDFLIGLAQKIWEKLT